MSSGRAEPPESSRGTAAGLWRLTRPGNVAIAALAVAIGAAVGPFPLAWSGTLGWAMAVAALVTAGGNSLNDVADLEVDRINKPWRPLPAGMLSSEAAVTWSVLLVAAGVALSLALPPPCRLIAAFAVVAVVLYDLWGKGQPLVGNLMVAFTSALAFLFGSLAVGHGLWGAIPAGIAFLFHLAREVVKDLEDMDADHQTGLRTLPLVIGERGARITAITVLMLLVFALPVPWLTGWLGRWYLGIAVIGVGGPALIVAAGLRKSRENRHYGRYAVLLKWDMLVGLAAVLAG